MPRSQSQRTNSKSGSKKVSRSSAADRTHIYVYKNAFLTDKARRYMALNNVSITKLIQRALNSFLNQDENYWNLVFKNLEHNSMEMRVMHGELLRLTNFFIHFVYYWFMLWPDTDPDQRKDLIEKAYVMVERFSKSFKRRLSSGGYVVDFSMEDIKSLILESAPELDAQELHEMLEEQRQKASKDDGSGG